MTNLTTKSGFRAASSRDSFPTFDNWFDPIEIEEPAPPRQSIEELIRGELDTALATAALRTKQDAVAGRTAAKSKECSTRCCCCPDRSYAISDASAKTLT